jgi:hypothetical protein
MKNQALNSYSQNDVFNPNKSQKIIDRLMTTDQQKSMIRDFIERTAQENCKPVDYQYAWETLGLEWYHFIDMIGIMGLEDLAAGLPSIDSLVTRKGNLMPSDKHFELRIDHGYLLPDADCEKYHLDMIKRWCDVLKMDYEQYISTKSDVKPRKSKPKKEKEVTKDRPSVSNKHSLNSRSNESREAIQFAMKQPKGSFSFRELMRFK